MNIWNKKPSECKKFLYKEESWSILMNAKDEKFRFPAKYGTHTSYQDIHFTDRIQTHDFPVQA